MKIFKYETEHEKNQIIDSMTAQGYHLIEVANITEGNFLGFDDRTYAPPAVTPIEAKIDELQNSVDILILKQEGII